MAEIENKQKLKSGVTKRVATKVDMTPLVDLAFLLITFFMLATTLAKPKVMELNMPFGNITSPVKHAVTLLLSDKNSIYYFYGVDGSKARVTNFDGIRKVLLKYNKTYPNLSIVIKMDNEAKFGNLVDALDEMVITNSKRYSISDFTLVDKEIIRLSDTN